VARSHGENSHMAAGLHSRFSILKRLAPFKTLHHPSPSPLYTTVCTSFLPSHILLPPILTSARLKSKPSLPCFAQLNGVSTVTSSNSSFTDVSSTYLSVNIRCQKQDAVSDHYHLSCVNMKLFEFVVVLQQCITY
jgi:hypothetical protein